MSGYEGGGTFEGEGPDGPDGLNAGYGFEWGDTVADSNISSGFSGYGLSLASSGLGLSAAPGAGLSLAAPAGPGLSLNASQIADFGPASAPQLDTVTAGAIQSARAQLALSESVAASTKAASEAKAAATVKSGVSLLPGGGLLVAGVEFIGQVVEAIGSVFSGPAPDSSSGEAATIGTSVAPDLFAGADGPPDTGFTGGAPVLGYGGSVINNAPQTTTTGSGVAPSVFPGLGGYTSGFVPGGMQYGAGFVPGANTTQAQPSAALLLLAGAASLLFLG